MSSSKKICTFNLHKKQKKLMLKKLLFLPVIAFLLVAFNAATTTWKLDTAHSYLGFSVGHLTVSEIKGSVVMTEATITTTSEDFSDATVSMKADMNTIDTDNEKRDAHLKTADFFDTAKYPELTFQSTSFKKTGADKYVIKGNLTMHGITKEVTLDATTKSGTNPNNNKPITGMKITGSINRLDFDISKSAPEAVLTNSVAIEANLEFGKE